ncbi:endonuclease domain-containing protein [Microbacterium terricola]|uniref:DUF559 domain-containing protein n=1 Tax=Microbacterium terricola TaxID=344163 RepID=A0ABM8DWY8_9MICO|nr:endonuclease domain-containing protein [Microbacterium terricola]UYK39259.1 endonuclease domain-containing protein [Microbacterium terricola]BDV30020.1 hypothetical protein Microterr_06800 [Microbacterium terricola]
MASRRIRPLLTGGYIHRHDLRDQGWRPDAIRAAVSAEGLEIVRRMWVLAPSAPPLLRTAAGSGGILTCVSAVELWGGWRPGDDSTLHLALDPHSGITARGAHVHRSVGPVPLPRRRLVDRVENVLAVTATCLGHDDALAVWESLLNRKLVTRDRLVATRWRGDRARQLRDEARATSDSGVETRFVYRVRRAGIPVLQQVAIAGHDVDALIGSWLVVQTDGFAFHSDAAQRRQDIAHDRTLRALGYTVFRFDYHQVVNEWPRVEAEILAAIAQGLHVQPRPLRRARPYRLLTS